MQRVLSFEQTPPLSVPLRFFLSAPLFAVAAGLLLAWYGPQALATRWSPATLALTHLLTLGFLAMCMVGALLQILPVVAGIDIPHSHRTAAGAHALLGIGTCTLVAAFALASPPLFRLALPILMAAFAWLFGAGLRGVWRSCESSAMLGAIRLALVALAITVLLGGLAASGFAWSLPLPLLRITDLHAGWGLAGWVALLIAGVAYQVVPMFQVTPNYPKPVARWLAPLLFALLVCWTLSALFLPSGWAAAPAIALAAVLAGFAVTTLYLLSKRKRPKADATTLFWRTGLCSLCACATLRYAADVFPPLAASNALPLELGVLFIVGFGYSVINGMLYKIVPFLVWYHLQNRLAGGAAKAPNVRQILPDRLAERQFIAHLAALVLLAGAVAWPEALSRIAGIAFALSSTLLWWNLIHAARIYRQLDPASAVSRGTVCTDATPPQAHPGR